MPNIKITYTCACTRCGSVNVKKQEEADREFFETMAKQDPKTYWKEDGPFGVIFRKHEESTEANCRRSC